jgi:acetamidase/formamidase
MQKMILFALVVCAGVSRAADVSGSWQLNLVLNGEEVAPARVEFKVEGSKLTGTLNELKLEGSVEGEALRFTATRPNGAVFGKLEGRVNGNEISGTVRIESENNDTRWVARRIVRPTAAPQTRSFEPEKFQRHFSGAIEPVLHINPGDTVRTWTVDAGGTDPKKVRRSLGGNPETGPFYIDGAMPGDTLAIRFTRIRLNRDSAMGSSRIVGDALGPGYIRDAKYDDKFSSDWKLDLEGGFATLAKPSEHLQNFRVPLQPMLGCVGVAPPDRQSFQAGWLGSWGGNMDYNALREGVTLYLPVYQAGALLFVGDGHAAQGDGELTGNALETSMEVEFTVNLISNQSTGGPRAEDEDWIMAMGIAGSLGDALRQATTQLARWLERDYHLTPNESAVVLGTSVRYDLAEIVDPQVNVVAKLSKKVLAQLGR